MVWSDRRNGETDIYFARLDTGGVKVGVDLRLGDAAGGASTPAITWNGDEFAVAWSENRDGQGADIYLRGCRSTARWSDPRSG